MEKEKILQEEYIIKLKKNDGVWDLFEKKPDENVQKKLENLICQFKLDKVDSSR